ncbi:MAG: helix-turn-helix transcriptional regulator [Actinobacteria bacterium]|nr:MAG: helix-turn-helix transcriptional regulator [Actinomycetota bacterium]
MDSSTAQAGFDAGQRELSGQKVQRIVDAMRHCVAERGIAGATFEHVSREAGVSRGLLHYYFGTKERLLIEVLRSDAETRIAMLDEPLAAAETVDDVIAVLVSGAEQVLRARRGAAPKGSRGRALAALRRRVRGHLHVRRRRRGRAAAPYRPGAGLLGDRRGRRRGGAVPAHLRVSDLT